MIRPRSLSAVGAALVAFALWTGQLAGDPADVSAGAADSLEAHVDSLMAEYDRDDSPGAVVGVIRGGEVAFAEGYGMADLAHGVPITPGTSFNLGSGAKQFMAFAFALLESRGALSLEDPVAEHLPDWPTFDRTVTLRHLLTHTSGYREAYGTLALAGRITGRDHLPREEALEVVRRQPALEFPAGSDWKYNSTAFVILDEIARRVTGEDSPAWMEENVFDPLGMDDTSIEDAVGQVIPGAAYSYTGDREDGYRLEFSNRSIYGAAEVYTTVGDVARWFGNFRMGEVGGDAVRDRMRHRFVLTSGDTTDYALGLRIDEHRGLRRIQHGGSHAGYRAQLSYYPELDAGVVVMSNYDDVSAGSTADEVAEFAFAEHMEPEEESGEEGSPERASEEEEPDAWEPTAGELRAFAGRYVSPELETVYTLRATDDGLVAEHRWHGRLEAEPMEEEGSFRLGERFRIQFERNRVGMVTGFYAATGRTEGVWFGKRD